MEGADLEAVQKDRQEDRQLMAEHLSRVGEAMDEAQAIVRPPGFPSSHPRVCVALLACTWECVGSHGQDCAHVCVQVCERVCPCFRRIACQIKWNSHGKCSPVAKQTTACVDILALSYRLSLIGPLHFPLFDFSRFEKRSGMVA